MKIRYSIAFLPIIILPGCHQKPPEIVPEVKAQPVAPVGVQFADITGAAGIERFSRIRPA